MRNILFILPIFTLLLIAGCATQPSQDVVLPPQDTATTLAPTTTIKIQAAGTVLMTVGDKFNIENKIVELVSVSSADGSVVVKVDGSEKTLATSRVPKLINGLEIETQRVDYGTSPSEHKATFKVTLFRLGENEYYLNAGQRITVGGHEILFRDLTNIDGVDLTVDNTQMRLALGETDSIFDLKITHLKAFNDNLKANKYAVLKIEKIE